MLPQAAERGLALLWLNTIQCYGTKGTKTSVYQTLAYMVVDLCLLADWLCAERLALRMEDVEE